MKANSVKKLLTLVYLIRGNEICLGFKKRGFGAGNWNGYGGKLEVGETIEDAAIRELKEESGVHVEKDALEQMALLEFFMPEGVLLEVHAFFARTWKNDPTETEEMKPGWFHFENIPYEKMWADDPHWLPRALQGEQLHGKVWFAQDGTTITKMEWSRVDSFQELF